MYLEKIVSGGQTGVDRAALDVAIFLDLPHGGWCPRHRLAEDGPIPSNYLLQETDASDYAVRTERNVCDSDGTLILYFQSLSGGSKLTAAFAKRHRKPLLLIDLNEDPTVEPVHAWLETSGIRSLNVAGPRESSVPGIGRMAETFLFRVFCSTSAPWSSSRKEPS